MTGYDLLENELAKRFNRNKINANTELIHAVVEIMAENPEEKMAISLAEKLKREAKEMQETNALEEGRLFNWSNELFQRECQLKSQVEAMDKDIEVLHRLEECETAEARDKMRLAWFFMDQDETSYDKTAFTKGLSNILGNGARQNNEKTTI